jgi:hypothetical protein
MRMGLIMHEVSNQLTHDPTSDEQRVAARVDAIVRDSTSSYDIATAIQEPLFTVDIKRKNKYLLKSWLAGKHLYFLDDFLVEKWDYNTGVKVWTKQLPYRQQYLSIPGESSPIPYIGSILPSYIGPINSSIDSPFAVNIGLLLLIMNPDTGDIIQEVQVNANLGTNSLFDSAGTMLISVISDTLVVWQ